MTLADYRVVVKAIRSSKNIDTEGKDYLFKYLTGVKNGTNINDFYEEDFLMGIILEFIDGDIDIENTTVIEKFESIISNLKFLLPFGKETENYKDIKNLIVTSCGEFNKSFYSLFVDKYSYGQIVGILNSYKFNTEKKNSVYTFGINVAQYCESEDILKKEIISYMDGISKVQNNIEEYYEYRIGEAKKKWLIYPIDEKTLATIAEEARRAQGLIKKLENMQDRVNAYFETVRTTTAAGKKEIEEGSRSVVRDMQASAQTALEEIKVKLDDYLLEIEAGLKSSSDEVFNQILQNTQAKLNEIKLQARALSNSAQSELIRIREASAESVDILKEYVENEPKLQEMLAEAAKSTKVRNAILQIDLNNPTASSESQTVVVQESKSVVPSEVIAVPTAPQIIVPQNLVVPTEYDSPILPAFDESIPFNKRFDEIMKKKEKKMSEGEKYHKLTDEIITCIMEGDWVYLWGPSGCGKSYVIRQVADLLGIDIVENGKIVDNYSIMAYNDPSGNFRMTPTYRALVYGKLLSLDEFDNGNIDTQVVLNAIYSGLLDVLEKPTERRKVTFAENQEATINPNFRMISAGNTACAGEDSVYNARGKIDESVQERMTPKRFDYDNEVERKIFGSYKSWYESFVNFREACDRYAKEAGYSSAPGMLSTRDASAIVKYIRHNSKSIDQIIAEKFTQTKDKTYLSFIKRYFEDTWRIPGKRITTTNLSSVSEADLAAAIIQGCDDAIKLQMKR